MGGVVRWLPHGMECAGDLPTSTESRESQYEAEDVRSLCV